MKKIGGDRLKCVVYESTLSTATRFPFPNGEVKEEGASLPQKEANPASLRSAAPSKGRGSRGHSLLPMEGGAPKGRRLDGGSGMKESGKIVSCRQFTKAPERRCAVPLLQWGSQRGGGFAAPKGSQPRLAALGSPFQGKGLAWTLPPSYGRRCPEGAEVGWEKRYEKERERSSQVRRLRVHPIHRCAVPLPQWGRLRYESTAIPISSERIHACVEKQYPRHKAFPSRGRWRAK